MKRLSAAIAVGVLIGAGALSGCSGGDGSDYCNRVRDNAKNDTLENIDTTSPDALKQFLTEAKKLQADAPDDVKDEYDTVVKAFDNPTQADQKEVTSAIDKIQAYDEDHCDVEYENS